MDPLFTVFSDYTNYSSLDDEIFSSNSDKSLDIQNKFNFNTPSPDLNFLDFSSFPNPPHLDPNNFSPASSLSPDGESFAQPTRTSPGGDSSSGDSDFSETVLKFINQILMEENMEEKPSLFYDPLALRATEKSLYEVLGEKYPPSPNQPPVYVKSPDGNFSESSSDYAGSGSASTPSTETSNLVESHLIDDAGENNYNPSFLQNPISGDYNFQSKLRVNSQFPVNPQGKTTFGDGLAGGNVNDLLVQNFFNDSKTASQFRKGFEEASKFLPSSNQLIIDLESYNSLQGSRGEAPKVVVKEEKGEVENFPNGSKGRKNHKREEDIEFEEDEGRSNKQSAVFVEESEISDMFDKVLLCTGAKESTGCSNESLQNEASSQPHRANSGKTRGKKQSKNNETVDLRTLLILCAQAVNTNDRNTANELLKPIRQNSSPFGDGSQRLAHFFANGLEARLAGISTGSQIFYSSLASKKVPAFEVLKAYQVHISACPFNRFAMFFANCMILKVAEKATTLHIIDFGIQYGFQWPILIQHLSNRPGGPCKLRITGIELPQSGFRPDDSIKETGRRLAMYCERFKVPFEYNAIASQNWETIQIEDLKIDNNEVLAVNSLCRLQNLLDETIEVNCPRNAVLNLIRKMNPNIFTHSISNGSYNAPFFVTRFREALFHFSSLYDMWDTTIPREDQERLMFEREFYGREAMNVIACEGLERVERPETYKQWQTRNIRAGFRQLPLDKEVMTKFRAKMKGWYHKSFVIDEDSHWMLQGWKGRIIYASSCWVPAQNDC